MSGFAALDLVTQEALYPGDLGAQAEATYGAILRRARRTRASAPSDLLTTTRVRLPDGARRLPRRRAGPRAAAAPAVAGVDRRVCGGLLRPEFLLEVFPTALLPGGGDDAC